jgi:hypothetical protein
MKGYNMEDEEVFACVSCNQETDDDYKTASDEPVCSDCIRICERCDTTGNVDDDFRVVDDNVIWCESCCNYKAHWCDNCEEWHTGDVYYAEDRNGTWCDRCWMDVLTYCEGCSEYYYDPCGCMDEDERFIHDYSYTPDLKFRNANENPTIPADMLYLGMEIELEAPHGSYEVRNSAAEYASNLEDADLAYLKSDGSLNCGFEVVTHPMTHEYFKNHAPKFWEVIEGLRNDFRMRAWSASSAGIHIHLSRAGFNNGSHIHRFLQLVYANPDFYSRMAGRNSDRWAKFDDNQRYDTESDKYVKTYKHKLARYGDNRSDRYSAVNTLNRNTLEMRIFRSTLNPDTIKSALDLAHASVEYTRTLTVNQIVNGALERMNFIQFIHDNKDTYAHLISRMDRLFIGSSSDTE